MRFWLFLFFSLSIAFTSCDVTMRLGGVDEVRRLVTQSVAPPDLDVHLQRTAGISKQPL